MTKLFVSRTTGQVLAWGDQINDDLELCALAITPELIETLKRMERQTLAWEDQNSDLAEVSFRLSAEWFDAAGVDRIDNVGEQLLDNGEALIEIGERSPFDGLEPQQTELDRVLVNPLKGFDVHIHYKAGERFCAFTLTCYAKNGGVQVQANTFNLRDLEAPAISLVGVASR